MKILQPALLTLQQGSIVYHKGHQYTITYIMDLESILGREIESGEVTRLPIAELSGKPSGTALAKRPDLNAIPDEDWQVAQQRFEIIQPLVNMPERTRTDVENRSVEFDLHTNTLYGWIKLYEESGTLTSLMPRQRSDLGSTKLPTELEIIIKSVIEEEYLSKQQKSIQKVCDEVRRLCTNAGITPPHCNTVRNRIAKLSEELKLSRRRGRRAAEERFAPIEGNFPNADWPLAVVQIDHTKLDIILVDDVYRQPLDRPWITLAIDVFSRMVYGFYISFDPPGALSTGLCLAQAILSKDKWLAKHGIGTSWPCWGLPKTLHMDNAKEFRGAMLQRACSEYGINIEWRPVARPHFGGHIERLLGTLLREVHTLPGSTFSNPNARGEYDSEGNAALTLAELEKWLATYITEVYHQRTHTGIGMPPIRKYEEGIFGTKSRPGIGMPAKILDEDRLRQDFMPFEERTVQDYGVVIDEIHYYHDVLRRWISATIPGKAKLKRKFIFKRDPRDISTIWFFDPELNIYFPIPYRDTSHPPISIWELRKIRKQLELEGKQDINERLIFDAYERMREIELGAKAATKQVRKAVQRRPNGQTDLSPKNSLLHSSQIQTSTNESKDASQRREPIAPFDEMEEY
ncbi:integrase core domain protein [Collimonas arenae]|uniref:Integrase core domain protein n=1 Tax=Collimonas arenae TaxID=279058 RepID=A0A127QPN4_9BURK|nr:Mu transposase C-terminal domain-containing protein [Collimonas arenae]AMP12033.1 integrase core domain protein [Collimonas arenae]